MKYLIWHKAHNSGYKQNAIWKDVHSVSNKHFCFKQDRLINTFSTSVGVAPEVAVPTISEIPLVN